MGQAVRREEKKQKERIIIMARKNKKFVHRSTVWNNVGGGLSSPGASKLCKVRGHKVLISRSRRLNKYGNPVHTVSVLSDSGNVRATTRGSGSATLIASRALKKVGIDTKYRR